MLGSTRRVLAVGVGVIALSVSACSKSTTATTTAAGGGATTTAAAAGGGVQVGVILPDTQSSARWETADRPAFEKAFKDANVTADIENAQGDEGKMASIADGMIQKGVKVIILTSLKSESAATIEAKAKAAGIATIDYDRLVLNGSSDYYVSYDGVEVGKLQGAGLVKCLGSKANAQIIEINGSPTDNNAKLFKQGYDSVLDPKYTAGWKKVGDQSIDGWKNDVAGTTFTQLLTANGGKVDGVLVANDGMAQSVITALQSKGLKVPVTGQDATKEGLISVLKGEQCMTVYKDAAGEAGGAAKVALAIINKTDAGATGTVNNGTKDVKTILLKPVSIDASNVNVPIDSGAVAYKDVCGAADVKALCDKAGIKPKS